MDRQDWSVLWEPDIWWPPASWLHLASNACQLILLTPSRSLRHIVLPGPWRNELSVHGLELEARLIDIGGKRRFRRLEPVLVVTLGEVGFIMRAARLVPQPRALRDHPAQLQHVIKLTRKRHGGICPLRTIAEIDVPEALQQFAQLGVGLLQVLVVADDGAVLGHQLAKLAPELERVFGAVGLHQGGVDLFLPLAFSLEAAIFCG